MPNTTKKTKSINLIAAATLARMTRPMPPSTYPTRAFYESPRTMAMPIARQIAAGKYTIHINHGGSAPGDSDPT